MKSLAMTFAGGLITRTYALEEINQGYADLDGGRNLRGVVVFPD